MIMMIMINQLIQLLFTAIAKPQSALFSLYFLIHISSQHVAMLFKRPQTGHTNPGEVDPKLLNKLNKKHALKYLSYQNIQTVLIELIGFPHTP